MNKHVIRNLSLLGVALTLCVALLGVGYGHWTDTLTIEGYAVYSDLVIEIVEQETNDPLDHWQDTWNEPPIQGADESILDGFQGSPWRLLKDVGMTDCVLIPDDEGNRTICEFYVYNAYPSYFGKLTLRVMNQSTSAWVQVESADVIYPDTPEYNFSSPPTTLPPWPHPDEFEVQWTNGAWNLPIKIPPGQQTYLGCEVHVLQPAQPGQVYTFRVEFNFAGSSPDP